MAGSYKAYLCREIEKLTKSYGKKLWSFSNYDLKIILKTERIKKLLYDKSEEEK